MVAILFLISFAGLIAVSYLVEKRRETVTAMLPKGPARDVVRALLLPKGIFLSSGHTWAEILSNGHARIGVDDFIRRLVGRIDRVQVPPAATKVERSQPLCTIYQGDRSLTIRAPLSGTIVQVNASATGPSPSLNEDSYVGGWLAVIEPSDLASEIKSLKVADEATGWLTQELRRFREFVAEFVRPSDEAGELALAGTTLLDGGVPVAGLLRTVGLETWKGFEQRFLSGANKNSVND